MTRIDPFNRLGSFIGRLLLVCGLVFSASCGSGEYDSRLQRRIQQLKAEASDRPAESADAGAESQAPTPGPADESDENLEDPVVNEDLPEEPPVDPDEVSADEPS